MFSGTGATAASGTPENAGATLLILTSAASGVRDGERDTKTCLGTELRGLGLNDKSLKERAESRVVWVTA